MLEICTQRLKHDKYGQHAQLLHVDTPAVKCVINTLKKMFQPPLTTRHKIAVQHPRIFILRRVQNVVAKLN